MAQPDGPGGTGAVWSWREDWPAPAFALLAVAGLAGVLGPSGWSRAGVLLLCLLTAPVWFVLCRAAARRGAGGITGALPGRLRLAVLLGAVAAPLAAFGWVAFAVHHSAGYAMRYGTQDRIPLPEKCVAGSATATCDDLWKEHEGDPGTVLDNEYRHIQVHFGEAAWAEYGRYYSLAGIGGSAGGIDIDVRIVGGDAHVTTGLHPSRLAPLGVDPLPWLASATLPALLVPLSLRLRAPEAPSVPAPPSPEPAAGATGDRTVTVASATARVTAEPGALVVERVMTGAGGSRRWGTVLETPWRHLSGLEFGRARPGGPVALYARRAGSPPARVLDAADLAPGQWAEVAAAVAARTGRRVVLDPAGWFPEDTPAG
ncbi:hypothetical protein [Streptomyces fumanus]|uniref:Uncharacterized protein n=1 Tax=Streptomyces fumanus TaxID=67302 RepID=A0A919DZD2_9ACTN|nr:hypothetical protein [Streptomyces fumanus]GHF01142.1 hypothetical protein GCM10018772_27400 [Streptomyces fumanus]